MAPRLGRHRPRLLSVDIDEIAFLRLIAERSRDVAQADLVTVLFPGRRLVGSHATHGVLTVARRHGRPAFTTEELDMATGFANQASVARARVDQQRAALLDELERIAADLHDHVIQRLFASGLTLQAVAATLGPGRAMHRVLTTVADLDTTISQIRTAIFALQQPTHAASRGLRARLLDIVTDVTPALGFQPALRFSGLLDTLPEDVADDLLAVVREALTNTARHGRRRGAHRARRPTHPRRP